MANINNHFTVILTSTIILFVFAFITFFPNASHASDPIFTVEGVKVDVTAENAIAAREKAFEEAQIKAFQELSFRMLPDTDIATTKTPAVNIISTMIKDFELTNEQLSSVRYIGTYIFRFKDRDVRRYFASEGSTVSDISSKKLLVLPFLSTSRGTILWTPGNTWMQAWNRVPNLGGLVPLEVPIGDISDVRDISDSQALSYDPQKLSALLSRYGAEEAVIAIAYPDTQFEQLTNPEAIAQGRVEIEIYRTDRHHSELVQQVYATSDGKMTSAALYDRGVKLVRSALQKDWKIKTSLPAQPKTGSIDVVVPIRSLSDWVAIQSELYRVSGISNIVLQSLTPTQANVTLSYKGGQDRLALTLAQAGLEIERTTASDGSPVNLLTKPRETTRYKPMRF